MALLKLRTEPGNFKKNNGKSRTADLLQRVPTVRSLQSVRPTFRLAAADQDRRIWSDFPVLTQNLEPTTISEFVSGSERQGGPAYTAKVQLYGARHKHRGLHEL